jgi:hypothetical protein
MSFLDKAKDLLGKHDDKVDQGIEKVGDLVDDKLPGHSDKVDQAQDFLQEKTGEGDTQE